ncbi:MAG: hypothetical protein MZV63_23555 [Marinilabiliales bacterium]|nr:hypothetical protein [Marinilabiliales bacterium]
MNASRNGEPPPSRCTALVARASRASLAGIPRPSPSRRRQTAQTPRTAPDDAARQIDDKEMLSRLRGRNVLVFTNEYNGMFFDEKTAGIELIHHGVRTATGGAVRLSADARAVGPDSEARRSGRSTRQKRAPSR